jgi:RND family efflux transporter MFP subunit
MKNKTGATNSVLLSIVLISCVTLFSCEQKKPPTPSPVVPVNLFTVAKKTVLYYDKYPSTTQALSQVTLLSQVQGAITQIYVADGADVKKGQVLYEIDRRLYQQAYDAAVANLRVAQSNQLQAQQDADRYVYLNSFHAVAKQLYDHAVIALQTAKDQVESADQSVKTARTNLSYSIITAPFDGTVGFSQVKLGNVVSVGTTVLNTISTNDPIAVDFLINEKQLPSFEALQDNTKQYTDSLFTMMLPNDSLYPALGKISVIDRAVDPQTGSIRIRLIFPNPNRKLKVGMSCVVRVHNKENTPQMLIPNKAVLEQMGEYFVFVAKDTTVAKDSTASTGKDDAKTTGNDDAKKDTANKKAQGPQLRAIQKKVVLGQTIGPNVIVISGIHEGDKIVSDGLQSVHDGTPITTADKTPAGNGKSGAGNGSGTGNKNNSGQQ